jgi:SAM-dependent methyltransferase
VRITDQIRRHYRLAAPSVAQRTMQAWFATPAGSAVLDAECASCRALPAPVGFRLAHLGVAPGFGVADCFPHPCRFSFAAAPATGADGVVAFDALPLPSDTIDVVVLHHALDFSDRPHAVLAEAARVLRPGGRLILVGFNPYSRFGVTKWLASPWCEASVWRHNSLRRARLKDWLALLGFGVDADAGAVRPRWSVRGWGRPYYVITATKRAVPMQPLHARVRARGARLLAGPAGGARTASARGRGVG